jgi:hypothetical protein
MPVIRDAEGFEVDVLAECVQALAEHRIELIQLERNACSRTAVGADRQPIADLLARHGYRLDRPGRLGKLLPIADSSSGPDVFAWPKAVGEGREPTESVSWPPGTPSRRPN